MRHDCTRRALPARTRAALALATSVGLAGAALPASATATSSYDWPGIEAYELGTPTDEMLAASVLEFDNPAVLTYETEGSVRPLDTTETDGAETVVTLASDILFDTGKADLTDSATARIGELVTDVPEGATVKVYGHTDSTGSAEFNQGLSERRAEAVATAIGDARPDLKLDVEGFGESQLKVTEGGDDVAEDRAANRRVEIRYEG